MGLLEMTARPRRTLKTPTERLTGIGLHSGQPVAVRVLPAAPCSGLTFRLLPGGQEFTARAANVVDTSRCTRLGADGASVQTVEHLLSALAGLEIIDAVIESEGGELPAMDGSAAPFVAALQAAGVREGNELVAPLRPSRPLLLAGGGGATIAVLPAEGFSATVVLDYPDHPFLGTQAVTFEPGRDDYAQTIAPARTYGFLSELEQLRAHGLALGASRENAVVLGNDRYESVLRFPDELARHKLLDLIGDLALVGRPLAAHVFAVKPSHTLNVRLAALLSDSLD